MPTTSNNKQKVLNRLLNASKKTSAITPVEGVLEQFLYGLCREGGTPEQADIAYQNLTQLFYDWNEVRVSSTREVEDALGSLPDTETRAQRIISFLQEVFEEEFEFNLDRLQKEGLKQGAKKLARYQAANEYVCAWVVQRSLGGHAIPLDDITLRCVCRLGLIDEGREDAESARAALEHLVPKAKGMTFTDNVSVIAATLCHEDQPRCSECMMQSECPFGQEQKAQAASAARASKVKTS